MPATPSKRNPQFYLIYWYKKDRPDYSGHDLVYAKNKREARAMYKLSHYSPISAILGPGDEDYDEMIENISYDEFNAARLFEVVNIEEGT